ncbi:hypothetical protein CRUP_019233 [Coryphaenoides rupestris]|nr:hypothetical protein CRUP_019233 [Coryphaenoides rupestris]
MTKCGQSLDCLKNMSADPLPKEDRLSSKTWSPEKLKECRVFLKKINSPGSESTAEEELDSCTVTLDDWSPSAYRFAGNEGDLARKDEAVKTERKTRSKAEKASDEPAGSGSKSPQEQAEEERVHLLAGGLVGADIQVAEGLGVETHLGGRRVSSTSSSTTLPGSTSASGDVAGAFIRVRTVGRKHSPTTSCWKKTPRQWRRRVSSSVTGLYHSSTRRENILALEMRPVNSDSIARVLCAVSSAVSPFSSAGPSPSSSSCWPPGDPEAAGAALVAALSESSWKP